MGAFDVEPEVGSVFVARPLDYEAERRYQLRLVASDGRWENETLVVVEVLNRNDEAPVFSQSEYRAAVTEELAQLPVFILQVSRGLQLQEVKGRSSRREGPWQAPRGRSPGEGRNPRGCHQPPPASSHLLPPAGMDLTLPAPPPPPPNQAPALIQQQTEKIEDNLRLLLPSLHLLSEVSLSACIRVTGGGRGGGFKGEEQRKRLEVNFFSLFHVVASDPLIAVLSGRRGSAQRFEAGRLIKPGGGGSPRPLAALKNRTEAV